MFTASSLHNKVRKCRQQHTTVVAAEEMLGQDIDPYMESSTTCRLESSSLDTSHLFLHKLAFLNTNQSRYVLIESLKPLSLSEVNRCITTFFSCCSFDDLHAVILALYQLFFTRSNSIHSLLSALDCMVSQLHANIRAGICHLSYNDGRVP